MTYQAIAREIEISPHTVDAHIRRLRRKAGVNNRSQLVVLAVQLGIYQVTAAEAGTDG
ncbi:response regulator transcription factor [Streptomyces sp. MI02-7b]|uniref:response regulator transcription factor n=1 Tax=Streptomyces sp. MI02-7b TaxID=462941 RepID=UPI0039F604ED